MGNGYSKPRSLAERLTLSLFGYKNLSLKDVKEYLEERKDEISIGNGVVNNILSELKDGMIEVRYVKKEDRIKLLVARKWRKLIKGGSESLLLPEYV